MAIWLYEVDIASVMQKCREGEITIQETAKGVAEAIGEPRQKTAFSCPGGGVGWIKDAIQECACDFEVLAEDPCSTEDDFDAALERLYDVGDYLVEVKIYGKSVDARLCWVKNC